MFQPHAAASGAHTSPPASLQIVAHCNMIWSGFDSEAFISEADSVLAYEEQRVAAQDEASR